MSRVALVNPRWDFAGSIYFGCREPHLPLELGYARALLERDGHRVLLLDAHLEEVDGEAVRERVAAFAPDLTVVPSAPTYLFWRCPPPELRVPAQTLATIGDAGGHTVVVGPHASTSPTTTLRKLDADAAVLGECEEVIAALANTRFSDWASVDGLATREADGTPRIHGSPHTTDLGRLPALAWPDELVGSHRHHHHRFDAEIEGAAAEIEWSRGCPFRCTFCAKETHRDRYRKRPLPTVLAELDGLISQGVGYVYFIDEIFLPDQQLLAELRRRPVRFGVQTRIDLWSLEELDLLGLAGCVTIEAGIESLTAQGRDRLDKRCRLDNVALAERLVHARRTVPFVQATLMRARADEDELVAPFRDALRAKGVWVNDPVPLFPYPGSPDYRRRWGEPDERAWERAHAFYLGRFDRLSDIQDQRVVRLPVLEGVHGSPS